MPEIKGFDSSNEGVRIDNQPEGCGTLTGKYCIDPYGCWWEYVLDQPREDGRNLWMIGDYPEDWREYQASLDLGVI